MRKSRYKSPKTVLVFNGTGRMLATACSLRALAELMNLSPMVISQCCTGKSIASSGYYFRYENSNVIVDNDDCGKLNIEEYDLLCGVKRTYKSKAEMNRVKASIIKRKKKDNGLNNDTGKNKK